jgi:hypothetical protein
MYQDVSWDLQDTDPKVQYNEACDFMLSDIFLRTVSRGEHTGVLVPRSSIDEVSIGSGACGGSDRRTDTHVWLGSWWNVRNV